MSAYLFVFICGSSESLEKILLSINDALELRLYLVQDGDLVLQLQFDPTLTSSLKFFVVL
jgi:hypothetical protein